MLWNGYVLNLFQKIIMMEQNNFAPFLLTRPDEIVK